MRLKVAKVVSGCRVGGPFQERREPLPAVDVAALSVASSKATQTIPIAMAML
jgi:hypothetical protein